VNAMAGKVLITGSSGMLGIDLCRELSGDFDVYGMDVAGCRVKGEGCREYCDCDITDKKNVLDVVSKIKPDAVIHAAAMTDVDGCESNKDRAYRINALGTENVALACKKTGAILIYISTDFVFDGRKKSPYKETDKTGPLSIYGGSKLEGEKAVANVLKKYFILRTSWLYGAHGKNFVDTIIANAKTGKTLRVVDDQVGSPTYTKDLSKAIHKLLSRIFTQYAIRNTQYGTYHVSNSGSISWYGYAKEILRFAGSKTEIIPIPTEELDRPAERPAMSVLDNSKFVELTGYKMRHWKDALKEYILEGRER